MTAERSAASQSARHYLEFSATSTALRNTLDLVARSLGRPTALLHILDETEQYVLAESGAPGLAGTVADSQKGTCIEVIRTGRAVVVEDALDGTNPRRVAEPLVRAGLRSYVGLPLYGRETHPIGVICVVDENPRGCTADDIDTLSMFASIIEEQLELQRERLAPPTTHGITAHDVLGGLDDGSIRPWFQPVVDLASGTTTGFEALARWQHSRLGLLAPGMFLPSITGTDIILDLDRAILRAGARAVSGQDRTTLHSNISALHLTNNDALNKLVDVVANCGLAPERIGLEVTEADAVMMPGPASAGIDRLRELGVKIFLDDLGTGWSTLTRLLQWRIDGVKLDTSVASALGTAHGDTLIGGIVDHARKTGVALIVEGIETAKQAARAAELGCTLAQGFFYAAPRQRI